MRLIFLHRFCLFCYLMAYQPSWVIQCQSHPSRITVVVLFNPLMGGEGGSYLSQGYCPKVYVIAQLEFELAYYDSAVQCFNHYTTRTPHHRFWVVWLNLDFLYDFQWITFPSQLCLVLYFFYAGFLHSVIM